LEPGGEGNENRAIGELYKPVITGKMEEWITGEMGNGRGMRTVQLGNVNGELYKSVITGEMTNEYIRGNREL
jgi:hypothetical protein